ncbi:dynamin family protein [uncultured Psychrobacter sp.]|uniref:dynamin family protein n=1 Tax=uncultured Psychrobacter sp. TaxID=259303 RepID=UPI00345A5FCC
MMNNNKTERRAEFLNSFKGLQKKFDDSLKAAEEDETRFKNECQRFQSNVDKQLSTAKNKLAENNPLSKQLLAFSDVIKSTNKDWRNRIDKQDTGVRFREGFNDSLMVFVYGKVKSGKSSLGNYVAWGHTDPDTELKNQTPDNVQPIYFSDKRTDVKGGDALNEAEGNKEFRVGATEATSTIQGFKLPGLTWIDSPGLHSKNSENDQLARDYVQHSDLILYTMKSDSPGRATDLAEIAELYQSDKRFLLLITGSDDTEIGWDEDTQTMINKVVMKDEQRRKEQREYIRSELLKIDGLKDNANNIDIIAFSARYAQDNQDSPEAFKDSGMSELFDILEEVSQSSGVKLKQQVPLKAFLSFLDNFKKDIEKYADFIDNFSTKFSSLDSEIGRKLLIETAEIKQEVSEVIRSSFRGVPDAHRDDGSKMNVYFDTLKNKVKNKQNALIAESIRNLLQEFSQGFDDNVLYVIDNSALYQLPEFAIETQKRKRVTRVIKGTRGRNSGLGSLIGAGAGFLVGGPAGAAVGGALGGLAGGATGRSASVEEGEFDVNVGDNLAEIEQNFIEITKQSIEDQMNSYKTNIFDSFLDELQSLVILLKNETIEMSDYFNALAHSIELQLNKLEG